MDDALNTYTFSTSIISKLTINHHEQVHHLLLDSFQAFQYYHNHFHDVIGTWLESHHFLEVKYFILLAMNCFHNLLIYIIIHYIVYQAYRPMHNLDFPIVLEVLR